MGHTCLALWAANVPTCRESSGQHARVKGREIFGRKQEIAHVKKVSCCILNAYASLKAVELQPEQHTRGIGTLGGLDTESHSIARNSALCLRSNLFAVDAYHIAAH